MHKATKQIRKQKKKKKKKSLCIWTTKEKFSTKLQTSSIWYMVMEKQN